MFDEIKQDFFQAVAVSIQLLHLCYIALHGYVKRTYKVHKMFISNIGIPEDKKKTNKHLQLLSSGTKRFITFELKRFST